MSKVYPEQSGLAFVLQMSASDTNGKDNKGKLPFTIYLPDYNSMQVYASIDSTINELIKLILRQHQDEELDPPLEYDELDLYELRMHEGDGEPDRDFPAYKLEEKLRNIESDEFCLCEVDHRAKDVRAFSINDSLFSPVMTKGSTSEKSNYSGFSAIKVKDRDNRYSDEEDDEGMDSPKPIPMVRSTLQFLFPLILIIFPENYLDGESSDN